MFGTVILYIYFFKVFRLQFISRLKRNRKHHRILSPGNRCDKRKKNENIPLNIFLIFSRKSGSDVVNGKDWTRKQTLKISWILLRFHLENLFYALSQKNNVCAWSDLSFIFKGRGSSLNILFLLCLMVPGPILFFSIFFENGYSDETSQTSLVNSSPISFQVWNIMIVFSKSSLHRTFVFGQMDVD